MAKLVAVMGHEIEHRGGHATGVCTVSASKHVRVTKKALHATKFFKTHKGIGAGARIAMIHTRFATNGSQANELNNHPVLSGNIIGCHNGIFDNDHELFLRNDWPRAGEVDSEAMFAAIHHLEDPIKAYEMMEGYAAVSWIDVRDPLKLHLARLSSSPLLYTRTAGGSLLYGSTQETILGAHIDKVIAHGDPYVYCELKEGQEVVFDLETGDLVVHQFRPIDSWQGAYRSYLTTQGSAKVSNVPRGTLDDWYGRGAKGLAQDDIDDLDQWWDNHEENPLAGLYINQRVELDNGVQGVILHIDRKNAMVDFLPFSNPVEVDAFDLRPVDPPRFDGQPQLRPRELTTGGSQA